MPVEDRLWRDHECRSPLPWDEAGEQGDQRPVRPGEAGSANLASKDRHLVAQHEDLGVLRERVSPRQLERSKGSMDQALEEGEHHGVAASLTPSWQVKTVAGRFWTLQGAISRQLARLQPAII